MHSLPSSSSTTGSTIDEMEAIMKEIESGGTAPLETAAPAAPIVSAAYDTPPEPAMNIVPPNAVAVPTEEQKALVRAIPTEASVVPFTPKAVNPIKQYVDPGTIKEEAAINPDDLTNACITQAGRVAHYGVQRAHAKAQASRMKAAFEILEGQLYEEHRERLEAEAQAEADRRSKDETLDKKAREKGAEKVTESMVNAAMKRDRRWFAAKNRLIRAEEQADLAGVACTAFSDRRDMIITLGADQREERKGQLRIMGEKAATDRLLDTVGKSMRS